MRGSTVMYVCTYIPIHNVVDEAQCLLNFHYDVGCHGLEIYPCIKYRLPQSFSLSVTLSRLLEYQQLPQSLYC